MSDSSDSESSVRIGCDSDSEGSVDPFQASELLDNITSTQVLGRAWILRGEITTDRLHANSDLVALEGDVPNFETEIPDK